MSLAITTPGRVWEEAASPSAVQLVQDFEARWQNTQGSLPRPDPTDFIPASGSSGGSGLLLALLRADLALRRASGEVVDPESYRVRYPDLADDVLVALIYEDYCLREEAGESPQSVEYATRFPGLASSLREIFEIHNLVKIPALSSTVLRGQLPAADLATGSFPTIGGFFVVEELGRGSFARVFLARERQLGDRLVALKVSKTGSREPQALARLQHTNIVPVHSYRIDPATDLHLLCMPYFGRITLAKLLDDPILPGARGGATLLLALDRLVRDAVVLPGDPALGPPRQAARQALAARTFARAVAWWGAQMADALRHAHDRGVLHRDLKPSNILIAADGTPMLLDFNLARELELPTETVSKLGGTLAYMAPEHLAALIAGRDDGVDHRADLYSLGLILVEMLGSKPLGPGGRTESPQRLLADRRQAVPEIPLHLRPLPPGLVAVLRRCLAPDPADRYASAGDLTLDLQAVADDAPLVFAREPWPSRMRRWVRQNITGLVGVALVGLLGLGGVAIWVQVRSEQIRRETDVAAWLHDGIQSERAGDFSAATLQFAMAADRAQGDPNLAASRRDALHRQRIAEEASTARAAADAFFARAEPLRFAILGFVGDPGAASTDLAAAFGPLGVLTEPNWTTSGLVAALDPARRLKLSREVDDLLYFWVVGAAHATRETPSAEPDRRTRARNAVAYCDQGLAFSQYPRPWLALRQWWADQADGQADPSPPALPEPTDLAEPAVCFRWSLLQTIGANPAQSFAWLALAARREPSNYWHQFALALGQAERGHLAAARAGYDAAIALRPDFPWAWKNRALLAQRLGDWADARADLASALAVCRVPLDRARVRIERGRIEQQLGDFSAARGDDIAVVATDPTGLLARDAQRDRARLEAASGAIATAVALYDALIAADPHDWLALQGRANLAQRLGDHMAATRDLDRTINAAPDRFRAPALLSRATLRLAQGQAADAWADARLGATLQPGPGATRLLDRIRLALGADFEEWPTHPAAWDNLPEAGPALRADLLRAADRLATRIKAGDDRPEVRCSQAVVLAAAGELAQARALVDPLCAGTTDSALIRLIRARIEHRAGDSPAALADIAAGLARGPEGAALMELRGLIRVEQRDFAAGLADLTVAYARGATSARGPAMAEALLNLGRPHESAEVWAYLIHADPTDAAAHLGLAQANERLGQWDRALANLEAAAEGMTADSPLLGRLIRTYAVCLPARPNRLTRVITLAQTWWHQVRSRVGFEAGIKPERTGSGRGR